MHLSEIMLSKYASLLVRFALNSGKGIKPGEVVYCTVPDVAKPFYGALQTSILEAGGFPMMHLTATGFQKNYYTLANDAQLTFFPKKYLKERVKLVDHYISILAEADLTELKKVDPKRIMKSLDSFKPLRDWQNDKEYAGKMTWTVALYGTPAMAKAANLNLKDYWDQIIKACYLDLADPITRWQEIAAEQNRIMSLLNQMPIDKIHLISQGTDLWITLGDKRRWVGGSGRNIPSFEIFTSPDWRGTSGHISFSEPLYRYGNLVEGVELYFQKGRIIKATAKKGKSLLLAMLKRKNADKIGEFSLTDARMSRITKFMANTLFDENVGGEFGNTHIAVGMSYKDAYAQDPRTLTKKLFNQLGFNDSGEHTDIVSTLDRTVSVILRNSREKVIYQNGRFTL